jgi:hypothetical protein
MAEVEAFLSRTGMAPTTLGLNSINDGTFVRRMRSGTASVTLRTADRIRQFMRENGGIPPVDGAEASSQDAAA